MFSIGVRVTPIVSSASGATTDQWMETSMNFVLESCAAQDNVPEVAV